MSLATRLHTFLLPRLRNDAQLLHHLQIVADAPVIPNLALRHSLHRHALYTKTLSENRQIEQHVGAGKLNKRQPVFGLLRPASAQAASLDEPRDRPLHYPSPRRVNPL